MIENFSLAWNIFSSIMLIILEVTSHSTILELGNNLSINNPLIPTQHKDASKLAEKKYSAPAKGLDLKI
jgi:hypothetical protein